MSEQYVTPYEMIGGDEKVAALVKAFYSRVKAHPDLSPIFPDDLSETERRQHQFLSQFFGGPPLYEQEHGHPRLRMRHMPFPITPRRAEAWLSCMDAAMNEVGIEGAIKQALFERLTMTAHHMVNTVEE